MCNCKMLVTVKCEKFSCQQENSVVHKRLEKNMKQQESSAESLIIYLECSISKGI